MIVVSDTSPIVSLALIGRLDLLRQIYGTIVIPQAVQDEITASGGRHPGGREVVALDWIKVGAVTNSMVVMLLRRELDRGEAEAIALAIESAADRVLLDERKARSLAAYLSLPFAGLLDILGEAKRVQLIPAIQPLMDELIARANFRISRKLYRRVLQSAGEMTDADTP